ncbi:hypothetical protein KST83_10800 [Fusobacterium nucleatum]|uniref:Uncharacterized protein n=1 Tax=Fusobacterium nucleatum subsp. polymorphum TaxID=76857 RepID=A0A2C6AY77_FUSNP|nr:hypothetical protein [Fusobacterium polymorphum]PHH96591.1 hypothetical protein CA840_04155 [Fusobacterium polymorphum]
MTRMNEKKWEDVLGNLKGKTFNLEDFENNIICICDTEDNVYVGDFETRAFNNNEFVGVYEEKGDNYILLEVERDNENETIEVIDGWVK